VNLCPTMVEKGTTSTGRGTRGMVAWTAKPGSYKSKTKKKNRRGK